MLVRSGVPSDFPALRPMLLNMGFVEDEAALEVRFPNLCSGPAHGLSVAETEKSEIIEYAAQHNYGPWVTVPTMLSKKASFFRDCPG